MALDDEHQPELSCRGDNRRHFRKAVGESADFDEIDAVVALGLDVPPSYAGVFRIRERLKQILPAWRTFDPESSLPDTVEKWCEAIDRIPLDDDFRQIEVLDHGSRTARRGSTYPSLAFGINMSYPVWVTLWYAHAAEMARAEGFVRLQAAFLAAHARLALSGREPSRPERRYQTSFLIFNLHASDYLKELDEWSTTARNPETVHAFAAVAHADGSRDLAQGWGALADLINEAFQLRRSSVFIKRSSRLRRCPEVRPGLDYQKNDVSRIWLLRTDSSVSDEDLPPVMVEVIGPGKELERDLIGSGVDPLEYATGAMTWVSRDDLVDSPANPTKASLGHLPSLQSLYLAASARQLKEIMNAQHFTTRLNRTTPLNLARIIGVLEQLAYHRRTAGADPVMETLRFLAVMMVTGAEPAAVKDLHQYVSAETLPKNWRLAYSPEHGVWLHPYLPPERQPLADRFRPTQERNFPRVARSDVWSVGRYLGPPKDGKWFARQLTEYKEIFDTEIAPKLQASGLGDRWRFESFSDFIYRWVLGREEGDQLRVAVLFDRSSPTGETQHFYTAFDRSALNKCYVGHLRDLWAAIVPEQFQGARLGRGLLINWWRNMSVPSSICGDDLVPRVESLVELVSAHKVQIKARSHPPHSLEWHNLCTSYLGLGLALTAGFRDIRTPIPDLTLIDPETGFFCLQEKDRKGSAHARLAWVAPRLRAMVTSYLAHLQRMWIHMPGDRHTRLDVKATKHRDRSQFNSEGYHLSLLHTLYFLEPGKRGPRAVEFTGATFLRQLDEVLPDCWPVTNAGRHFLRTYLVATVCPPVVINTLMGHWHVGESTWSDDSAMDPLAFRAFVEPHIEAMLNALGFEELEF